MAISTSRRQFLRLLAAGSGAALLTACTQPAPPAAGPSATSAPSSSAKPAGPAKSGGGSVVAAITSIDTINPMFLASATGRWSQRLYSDGLVLVAPDGSIQKALAESWSASPDLREFTYTLHPDARFHDGAPVTTADVRYTFELYAHPEYERTRDEVLRIKGAKEFRAGTANEIAGIRVSDPTTITFQLDEPNSLFHESIQLIAIFPKHVVEKIPVKDLKASEFSRMPVASGPFKVAAWKEKESIVFQANEAYFRGRPALDQIVFRIIPEPATIASELRTGGVNVGLIQPEQLQSFSQDPSLKVLQVPGIVYSALRFDFGNPIFADIQVRRALSHAVDREAILKGLAEGLGTLTNSHLHPSVPEFNPNVKGYAFDLDKARAMLDDAGWRPGPDGIRAKGDTKFSVQHTYSTAPAVERHALLVQRQLKEVGVELTLNPVDPAVFSSEFYKPGKFQTITSNWNNLVIPPYNELLFNFSSNGYHNVDRYSNPEVDKLLAEIPVTGDAARRKEIFWRVQEILIDDAARVMTARPDELVATSAGLAVPEAKSYSELMFSARTWSWAK